MKNKNNYGITSFTLGIIGIFFYLTLFLNISFGIYLVPDKILYFIAFSIVPIGILSIIFGALQIKTKKGKVGLTLGIITLFLVFSSIIISVLRYIHSTYP